MQRSVELTAAVKELALRAGFSRVGVAAAEALADDHLALTQWLEAGHHAQMQWLARDTARRCDPRQVVPGARSVIVLAVDYDSDGPRSTDPGVMGPGKAWIARYAWGDDYHRVIERRLRLFARLVGEEVIPALSPDFRGKSEPQRPWESAREFRYYVDHGPALERAWGQRAGLGWRGKHGLLVDPKRGSYFFLAVVITTLPLVPDAPVLDHCGSCDACVTACPTDAVLPTRSVDARRCISYVTIEAPLPLQDSEAADLHGHAFGCDICQDVCPFNRFSEPGDPAFAPRPGLVAPSVERLLALDDGEFRAVFARSAVRRRKHSEFQEIVLAAARNSSRE